jgi:nitrogen regulatory protein PII
MTLQTEKRTVLTVITESAIEKNLLRDLRQMGVRGYTIVDARGQGSRGVRTAAMDESANIRIEVICTRAMAEKVLEDFLARYYDNFAMVAYLQDVEIIRPQKF